MRDYAELLSAYFDESLTPAEAAQLRAWLMADEANWRTFVRESVIHSRLRDVLLQHDMRSLVFDEAFVDTVDPRHIASLLDEEEAMAARRAEELAEQERRAALAAARRAELLDLKTLAIEQPRVPQALVYASVVAAAALLLIAFRTLAPGSVPAEDGSVNVAAAPVADPPVIAELANSFDADLRRDDQPILAGAPLRPGRIVLERGVAQIKFASQVAMVVEGPAEVELLTVDRAKLIRGRVVVRVPHEALGFTLHSDAAAFVDLGTEFGVEVVEPGRASIHVIDGEVAFVPGNGQNPSKTLRRGAANEVSADGAVNDISFDEQKFVRRVPASAYELAVLKSRPLAYWRLDNVAPDAEFLSEGKLGLPTFVREGVAAAENRESTRVEGGPVRSARFIEEHGGIDVAAHPELGVVANCTYEAWVRPAAGVGPQRIFSTFDRPRSGMAIGVVDTAWYKLPEEELRFHLTLYGRYDCISTTALTPNEWVHLAATVADDGTPTLYVDGRKVDRRFRPIRALTNNEPEKLLTDADVFLDDALEKPQADEPPRPWLEEQQNLMGTPTNGAARLGRNPDGSDGKISPERWQGQVSNVAVYDRVLTAREIRQHMNATREQLTDLPAASRRE